MILDVGRAGRLDQALHGERFIRAEFLFAVLLMSALAGLVAVRLLARPGMHRPGLVLVGILLVFFLGGVVNYLALLWLARGPAVAPADHDELRSVTWRMAGLALLPGAAALAAWRQRTAKLGSPPPS
jgi:hypothetical protein